MNYYERVEKAIDYIECHLDCELDINDIVKEAMMSQTNFYRMFFALTGYSVKEYIRNRRFNLASYEIIRGKPIFDVAFKYGFDSHEAFTRSFKKVSGVTPSYVKDSKNPFIFERMSVMDKYFDIQDEKLLEKYPDIKVLKELEPVKVAYYCYYGKNPEDGAWNVIQEWLKESELDFEKQKLRVFGFNNPSPMPGDVEYGYEIWVTIPEDIEVVDSRIKAKTFNGGLYAVTTVQGGVEDIFSTWQRFSAWLRESKYIYGTHQWLEEHLKFDDDYNHIGGLDLYMPIELKEKLDDKELVHIEPKKLIALREDGPNAVSLARKHFMKWISKQDLKDEISVISWYNHEREGKDDYFCVIGIEYKEELAIESNMKIIDFEGGEYALMHTKFNRLGLDWYRFMDWVKKHPYYTFGSSQFFEQFLLKDKRLKMDSDVNLYMPINCIK